MSDSSITVRGNGVASVRPDGARLRLTVRRVAETPDVALSEATQRSQLLEDLLRELGIDESAWTTDLVAVSEERRWDERQQKEIRTGYSASAGLVVLLEDLSKAGPLMREAASRAEAQIAGPWWHVAVSNEAVEVACRHAVEDAVRKAGALATSLGAKVGAVRSIAETPALSAGYMPTAGLAGLSDDGPEEMRLQSGGLEVGVTVEVSFDLDRES